MIFTTEKNLGTYKVGQTIQTGLVAPYTGDYTLEISQCNGQISTATLELEAGDPVSITNTYNECCKVFARVRMPDDYTAALDGYPVTQGVNFLTDQSGAVLFTFNTAI